MFARCSVHPCITLTHSTHALDPDLDSLRTRAHRTLKPCHPHSPNTPPVPRSLRLHLTLLPQRYRHRHRHHLLLHLRHPHRSHPSSHPHHLPPHPPSHHPRRHSRPQPHSLHPPPTAPPRTSSAPSPPPPLPPAYHSSSPPPPPPPTAAAPTTAAAPPPPKPAPPPFTLQTSVTMVVAGSRANGSLVTCAQLFPSKAAVAAFSDLYVGLYAGQLRILTAEVQLYEVTCAGVVVPLAGYSTGAAGGSSNGSTSSSGGGSIGSSSSSGRRQLLQVSNIYLVMSQQLTVGAGTAPPSLGLLGSVAGLQSALNTPLTAFFAVSTYVLLTSNNYFAPPPLIQAAAPSQSTFGISTTTIIAASAAAGGAIILSAAGYYIYRRMQKRVIPDPHPSSPSQQFKSYPNVAP
ncbi:MAG: hypothetical protein WDW36_003445 [Sanguina aurantia]